MNMKQQDTQMDDTWGRASTNLLRDIGNNNFSMWIKPLHFSKIADGVAYFQVPTRFMGDWVSRNFGDRILMHLVQSGATVDRIQFHVHAAPLSCEPLSSTSPVAQADLASVTPLSSREPKTSQEKFRLPGASLDVRFTFDRFVVGKPNVLAHAAARRVAEGGPVSFNPLFLYGGVGLGKTHLMHAIAWELQKQQKNFSVLYLSAEQFMYRFVQALREKVIMDFKDMFRSVDVLMVDDVQFIAGKESTQEEFFHTFNALVDQGKQVIISADRAPGEIELEERIKSRLQMGMVVDLHPADYELRLGILQDKVEHYRQNNPDLVIADGVLEFLAHRITTNVRVLEGSLTRLFAYSSLIGQDITLELTQDCLTDILRTSDRKVTIEEIQRKVAEHYNIRLSDMMGSKRQRLIVRPRQIAMYLAKDMTPRSFPEIGRSFGGRDHTTVMHAIRKIDALRINDSQLAEDLDILQRALAGR